MEKTMKGWLARDRFQDRLCIYRDKPIRGFSQWHISDDYGFIDVSGELDDTITWDDEPKEVEIVVKYDCK